MRRPLDHSPDNLPVAEMNTVEDTQRQAERRQSRNFAVFI
jgi:hypothetical protein